MVLVHLLCFNDFKSILFRAFLDLQKNNEEHNTVSINLVLFPLLIAYISMTHLSQLMN